jgi:DNA-binding CsgD family transcriptional regulator
MNRNCSRPCVFVEQIDGHVGDPHTWASTNRAQHSQFGSDNRIKQSISSGRIVNTRQPGADRWAVCFFDAIDYAVPVLSLSATTPYRKATSMDWKQLTERQAEIMRRSCRGQSGKEIERALGLSPVMLASYFRNIRWRSGGASVEAICRASDPGAPVITRVAFDV